MTEPPNRDDQASPSLPQQVVDRFRNHWVVTMVVIIAACVGAAFGLYGLLLEVIDQRVAIGIKEQVAERVKESLIPRPVLTTQPDGTVTGSVSALATAINDQRPVYVTYIREANGIEHRWRRRCDHLVIDQVTLDGTSSVTCFMLRLPDTTYQDDPTSGTVARTLQDTFVFEDMLIRTDGTFEWRKYVMVDGEINDLTPFGMGNVRYRDAQWYVFPALPED